MRGATTALWLRVQAKPTMMSLNLLFFRVEFVCWPSALLSVGEGK